MKRQRKKISIISWGGLGDVLLSTPAIAALRTKYPQHWIVVFCRGRSHAEIYWNNPDIDELRPVSFWILLRLYAIRAMGIGQVYIPEYGHIFPSLYYRKCASEIIGEMMNVKPDSKKLRMYLTEEEDKEARKALAVFRNPVILHITSLTSPNNEWFPEKWESLIAKLPDYTFIQVGVGHERKIKGAIHMLGKTSFRQACALIKHARAFVGVGSSFSHASAAFDVPGVVLFGAASPVIWGHDRNINLYKAVHCAPCVDLIYDSECPYSKQCMNKITVDEVKAALLRQLG
ncbi:MAG TPA: glycosyltransferase family 9 protein [Puia sp.]|nr:glycosyltransferase family 9 protein [Puia sp.]